MFKSLLALSLLFSIQSYAQTKAELAEAAYANRDYNQSGADAVKQAIALYKEAITEIPKTTPEQEALEKRKLNVALASAHYFLGTALNDKDLQKAEHQMAMDIADSIMTGLGVDVDKSHELTQNEITDIQNRLDDENELILAEAFYAKGISLGQWGRLNGIVASLGRLPVVLGLMDRIEMMGYESIHEYGPYRTIGRANFILPKAFGGDLDKSEKYLKIAFKKTIHSKQNKYSINGYNNLYLAETMYSAGKENQAKKMLETFVNADPATFKEGNEPENREAVRLANELLNEWN